MSDVRTPPTSRTGPGSRDRGLTLVELLIVVTLLGLVVTVLSGAIIVILRTAPATELRVDDARSTRGLATWLSHDVASTPPFRSVVAGQGGFDLGAGANGCSAPEGESLLQMTWYEDGAWFVSNYRFVDGATSSNVRRYTCSSTGQSATNNLTSGLNGISDVDVELLPGTGDVEIVRFSIQGGSGEIVVVDTSSRNPAESF